MKQDINFAVIGCGAIGEIHAQVIQSLANANLVAAYDVRPDAVEKYAEKYGCEAFTEYSKLLERLDIDAVCICVPSGLHLDLAILAARAGKQIICEKPLGTTLEHALEMKRVCDENNVMLFPILQHRYDPNIRLIKTAIDDGKLGKIYWGSTHVILYRDDAYYRAGGWRGSAVLDGGVLLNQSIHYIDLMIHLIGKPASVIGKCATRRPGLEAEDVGVGCVTFTNGALGAIEGTTDAMPGLYNELNIYAEAGSIIFRNEEILRVTAQNLPELSAVVDESAQYTKHQTNKITPEGHMRQYEDIICSLRTGRKAYVTSEDGIESLKVILAMKESSRTGKSIQF